MLVRLKQLYPVLTHHARLVMYSLPSGRAGLCATEDALQKVLFSCPRYSVTSPQNVWLGRQWSAIHSYSNCLTIYATLASYKNPLSNVKRPVTQSYHVYTSD